MTENASNILNLFQSVGVSIAPMTSYLKSRNILPISESLFAKSSAALVISTHTKEKLVSSFDSNDSNSPFRMFGCYISGSNCFFTPWDQDNGDTFPTFSRDIWNPNGYSEAKKNSLSKKFSRFLEPLTQTAGRRASEIQLRIPHHPMKSSHSKSKYVTALAARGNILAVASNADVSIISFSQLKKTRSSSSMTSYPDFKLQSSFVGPLLENSSFFSKDTTIDPKTGAISLVPSEKGCSFLVDPFIFDIDLSSNGVYVTGLQCGLINPINLRKSSKSMDNETDEGTEYLGIEMIIWSVKEKIPLEIELILIVPVKKNLSRNFQVSKPLPKITAEINTHPSCTTLFSLLYHVSKPNSAKNAPHFIIPQNNNLAGLKNRFQNLAGSVNVFSFREFKYGDRQIVKITHLSSPLNELRRRTLQNMCSQAQVQSISVCKHAWIQPSVNYDDPTPVIYQDIAMALSVSGLIFGFTSGRVIILSPISFSQGKSRNKSSMVTNTALNSLGAGLSHVNINDEKSSSFSTETGGNASDTVSMTSSRASHHASSEVLTSKLLPIPMPAISGSLSVFPNPVTSIAVLHDGPCVLSIGYSTKLSKCVHLYVPILPETANVDDDHLSIFSDASALGTNTQELSVDIPDFRWWRNISLSENSDTVWSTARTKISSLQEDASISTSSSDTTFPNSQNDEHSKNAKRKLSFDYTVQSVTFARPKILTFGASLFQSLKKSKKSSYAQKFENSTTTGFESQIFLQTPTPTVIFATTKETRQFSSIPLSVGSMIQYIKAFDDCSDQIDDNHPVPVIPLTHSSHTQMITGISSTSLEKNGIIASCSSDNVIKIWNITEPTSVSSYKVKSNNRPVFLKRSLSQLISYKSPYQCLGCSLHPSGFQLAVSFSDHISIYSIQTSSLQELCILPVSRSLDLAFSNGGQYLATTSSCNILIFSTLTYKLLHILQGHQGRISSISWSRDDAILASGGRDGALYTWKIQEITEQNLDSLNISSETNKSLKHGWIPSVNTDEVKSSQDVSINSVSRSDRFHEYVERNVSVVSLCWTNAAISISSSNIAQISEPSSSKNNNSSTELQSTTRESYFHPDDNPPVIISSCSDNRIRIIFQGVPIKVLSSNPYSITTITTMNQHPGLVIPGTQILSFPERDAQRAFCSKLLFAGTSCGSILVFSLPFSFKTTRNETLEEMYSLLPIAKFDNFHSSPITRLSISSDGYSLLSSGADGSILFFNIASTIRPNIQNSNQPESSIVPVSFQKTISANERFLISQGDFVNYENITLDLMDSILRQSLSYDYSARIQTLEHVRKLNSLESNYSQKIQKMTLDYEELFAAKSAAESEAKNTIDTLESNHQEEISTLKTVLTSTQTTAQERILQLNSALEKLDKTRKSQLSSMTQQFEQTLEKFTTQLEKERIQSQNLLIKQKSVESSLRNEFQLWKTAYEQETKESISNLDEKHSQILKEKQNLLYLAQGEKFLAQKRLQNAQQQLEKHGDMISSLEKKYSLLTSKKSESDSTITNLENTLQEANSVIDNQKDVIRENQANITSWVHKNNVLEFKNKTLEQKIDPKNSRIAELETIVKSLRHEISTTEQQGSMVQRLLSSTQHRLEDARNQSTKLQARLEKSNQRVNDIQYELYACIQNLSDFKTLKSSLVEFFQRNFGESTTKIPKSLKKVSKTPASKAQSTPGKIIGGIPDTNGIQDLVLDEVRTQRDYLEERTAHLQELLEQKEKAFRKLKNKFVAENGALLTLLEKNNIPVSFSD